MTISHFTRFKRQFPGPYSIGRSHDGVDETYEVYCLASGRMIAATYFWDEEQRCQKIAQVLSLALNHHFLALLLLPNDFALLADFQAHYPGPFESQEDLCPGRGPCIGIRCQTTEENIIDCYGRFPGDRQSQMIAQTLLAALSKLMNRVRHAELSDSLLSGEVAMQCGRP